MISLMGSGSRPILREMLFMSHLLILSVVFLEILSFDLWRFIFHKTNKYACLHTAKIGIGCIKDVTIAIKIIMVVS